jgi:hypothetical protein
MGGDAVADGAHAVLTDAEAQVPLSRTGAHDLLSRRLSTWAQYLRTVLQAQYFKNSSG